ncbi:STAS domain-containing protein [Actinomadura napierensis]
MHPHLLPITLRPDGHATISPAGELDIATAPILRGALAKAAACARYGVVVELSQVSFMDASGLTPLITARRQTRHLPHGLRLAHVPDHIQLLLHLTGLATALPAYPTIRAAIRAAPAAE